MRFLRNLWYWFWYWVFWAIWQMGVKEIRRACRTSYDRVEQQDMQRLAKEEAGQCDRSSSKNSSATVSS